MRRAILAVLTLLALAPACGAWAQATPAARYKVPQPFTPPKVAPKPLASRSAGAARAAASPAPFTSASLLPPLAPGFSPAPASGSADVCRAQAARQYYACLAGDASDDSCPSGWARQRAQCGGASFGFAAAR